ncbi:MAG: hypothetical protein QOG42_2044 [Solirubrobacteraceae bacterium]|nr:hypothetical protein [Solirubrobacteraceae bacterium]
MSCVAKTTAGADEDADRKYAVEVGARGGFELRPNETAPPPGPSAILDDVGRVWDPQRYAVARGPIRLGRLRDRARFSRTPAANVSNVPVKFPGTGYRIPAELTGVTELLQSCIDCEHAMNPGVADCYAYLTVDRGLIPAGYAQRGFDIHADFLQGTRLARKHIVDHGYLCTDRDPPRFFVQPFELSVEDVAGDAYNAAFARQARAECAAGVAPYDVVLFDAYCVHGAVAATRTATRTFVRFFYSVAIYDRFGDTHNALFDYRWKMDYRPRP